MSIYTTEIASDAIPSDNPIHQRLLMAYYAAKPYVKGDLLELGVGEGRGVEVLSPLADSYTGIDKIQEAVDALSDKYPKHQITQGVFPPFPYENEQFDSIVTFQVIEHVKEDEKFVEEIFRVLKPGGVALITTPNIKMSLSRNPWHVREYTGDELKKMCEKYFPQVEMMGITGNEKVLEYYERNKASVNKIMRFDIFDLQHKLPAPILRIPYEILNRFNRNKLRKGGDELVDSITIEDFILRPQHEENIDLFCILRK